MFESFPNLHPLVVHFPLGLFLSATFGDAVLLLYARSPWLDRALTLGYAVAAVSSLASAVTGKMAEPASTGLSEDALSVVETHGDWAFFTVILCFAVAFFRFDTCWRDREAAALTMDRRRVAAFAVALVASAALVTTASYGGRLVFQHGIGVSPSSERGSESESESDGGGR